MKRRMLYGGSVNTSVYMVEKVIGIDQAFLRFMGGTLHAKT